jgi:hypothetical protein
MGFMPISVYQHQLIVMGSEIMRLWCWEPSPDMIKSSEENYARNTVANQHDKGDVAVPKNIQPL